MIVDRGQIAAVLPDYEFGEPIGQGPQGVVLAARHRASGADVAVKVLPRPEGGTLLVAPEHPHVVRVVECAARDDLWLVVSELVPGGSLVDRGDSAPESVCAWGLAAASALEAAHGAGVVHGGIKPTNFLLDASQALKVGDFGFALLGAGEPGSRYLAPERLLGGAPEASGDVYALAVVLTDLLGAPERPVPHIAGLLLRMLDDDPVERPGAGECVTALAEAAARDLGPDWPWRSGVPLRTATPAAPSLPSATGRVGAVPRTVDPSRTSPSPDAVAASGGFALPGGVFAGGWAAAPGGTVAPGGAAAPGGAFVPDGAFVSGGVFVSGRTRARWVRRAWVAAVGVVAVGIGVLGAGVVALGPAQVPAPAAVLGVPAPANPIGMYRGAPGAATHLAFAPSTERLAFVDSLNSLYVWTPKQVWAPGRPNAVGPIRTGGAFGDVRFEATDGAVLTTGTDGTVRAWQADTGKPRGGPLTGPRGPVTALAQRGNGGDIAVADATGIRISRSGAFAATPTIPGVEVADRGLVYSPDGKLLASSGPDGVQLFDAETGALRTRLAGATADTNVAFTADGDRIAAASGPDEVRVWSVASGKPIGPAISVGGLAPSSAIAFNDFGDELVTCVGTTVTRWGTTTGSPVTGRVDLTISGQPADVALDRNGTQVAVAADDGTIRIWSLPL